MAGMLKRIDDVLCYIITGLGAMLVAITPVYAGSFVSRRSFEFMGAALFLVFLGLLNLARIKSQHPSAWALAMVGNGIAVAYLGMLSFVLREAEAIGVILPVVALGFTALLNRTPKK
jgi:hypothetical protein